MQHLIKKGLGFSLVLITLATACRKKEAPLPDNLIQFESNEQGISESANSISLKIRLTRATDKDIPVTINLNPTGITYGTDITSTPAAVNGSISTTIASGNSETTIVISKQPGILFDGDETLSLEIASSGSPVIIGDTRNLLLKFAELIAENASLTGDGGGATFGNKVFFDLSANKSISVTRTRWDLGFYTQADSFYVLLNSSTGMMARGIAIADLNAVSAADTIGFGESVNFNQSAPTVASLAYIDYPSGDLSRTAIGAVAATAADNKVFIINRGSGVGSPAPKRGWKKIRILRNANGGYTLQHADIGASSFQEIQVAKTPSHFYTYVSFENGVVEVEPAKEKWDLAWTYFSNVTNFGGGEVPYLYQDIILQNRNVLAVKVSINDQTTYENFTEANLSGLSFSAGQTTIGADWRLGGGPSSAPSVRTDRFYVLKDAAGNYYKLRFTALTKNGERGYPAFEYTLIKKGN